VKVIVEKVFKIIKFLMVMAMCNTITPCKRWAYFKLFDFSFLRKTLLCWSYKLNAVV
jgi:hypothetical protein